MNNIIEQEEHCQQEQSTEHHPYNDVVCDTINKDTASGSLPSQREDLAGLLNDDRSHDRRNKASNQRSYNKDGPVFFGVQTGNRSAGRTVKRSKDRRLEEQKSNRNRHRQQSDQTECREQHQRRIHQVVGINGIRCRNSLHKEVHSIMNKAAADHTRTVGRVSRIVNDASVVLSKATVYMTDFNLNIRVVQLIFGKSARHTKVNGFLHFAFYAQVAWPVTFYWFETDARIRIVQASTKTKVDAGSQSIQRLERRSKD